MPLTPTYHRDAAAAEENPSAVRYAPAVGVRPAPSPQRSSLLWRFLPIYFAAAAFLLTLVPGYYLGRHLEDSRRFSAWKRKWSSAANGRPLDSNKVLARIVPTLPSEPGGIQWNERQFSELLTEHFEPDYWDLVGGPGHLEVLRDCLFITASPDHHQRLSQIIERLQSLPARPDSLEPVPLFEHPLSQEEVQIEAALDRITSLKYQNVSLRLILEDIGRRHGVRIVPAIKVVEETGFFLDAERTFEIRNISLRGCLTHLLADMGLTFVIKDGFIQVTTPEDCANVVATVLYPVHDLREHASGESMADLKDELTHFVEPDSWVDVGGPGEVVPIADGWLWVGNTPDVHAKLERFLATLRHELKSPAWKATGESVEQRAERAIWLMLDAPHGPELGNLSMRRLIAALQDHLKVPVLLNARVFYLDATDQVLTSQMFPDVEPLSLKLAKTLRESRGELAFRVHHEALIIYEHENPPFQRVFDVRDITETTTSPMPPEDLMDAIKSNIDRESWDSLGGLGVVVHVSGCLAVENTLENVYKVKAFLEALQRRTPLQRLDESR
jgi:hypothetical protein